MRMLVCVKQVVSREARPRIAASGTALEIDDRTEYGMSELDAHAVEAALRLRERVGGTVDAVTVGPARTATVVRRAMGMGADHGAHIVDDEVHDDPFRVAYCLAAFAGPRGYDLILTGVQSDDAMQGAVGPMVAACLGRPCATNVVATEWGQSEVIAVRELESGRRERVALTLPAVLTIQSGPDAPRYPSLSNLLRANRTELETHVAAAFNPPVARQCVARLAYPQPSRACVMLEGTVVDKARRLRALLVERNVL